MKMKINTMNCMNNIIQGINNLADWTERTKENYQTSDRTDVEVTSILEDIEEMLHDNFHSTDIAFQILAGYFERIAERAIELKDEKLIQELKDMYVIREESVEDEAA